MDAEPRRRLFLGPQVRKLRRSMGLTQAQMAEGLEISASYLTLIERNQRPLTAQIILRLAEAYEVDVRTLAPGSD
ncbi:MAG: helix-turn-helix transcriptional regulator, partial [Pseudomonadota bacterium]